MATYFIYMLRCNDGTLYTGITTDLERRVKEHNTSPLGARYTQGRRPVQLVYSKKCKNRSEATKEEGALKKLSRQEKMLLLTIKRPSEAF